MEKYVNEKTVGIRGIPIENAVLHDDIFLNSEDALIWNDIHNPPDISIGISVKNKLPQFLLSGLKLLFLKNNSPDIISDIDLTDEEKFGLTTAKLILASYFLNNIEQTLSEDTDDSREYITLPPITPLLFKAINNNKPLWLDSILSDNSKRREYEPNYFKTNSPNSEIQNHILKDISILYKEFNTLKPPKLINVDTNNMKKLIFKISRINEENKHDAIDFLEETNKKIIAPINKNKYIKSKEINQSKLKIDQTILFSNTLNKAIVRDKMKNKQDKSITKSVFIIYEKDGILINTNMIELHESYSISETWGNKQL